MRRTGSSARRYLPAAVAFCALGFGHAIARAEPPSITAEITSDSVAAGERVIYSLKVQNGGGGQPEFPRFGELQVRGPSVSQQTIMSWGSGGSPQNQSSVVYSWAVEAPHEGHFAIGPAKLVVNGQAYVSNSITLTATGQVSQAPQPQPQARNPSRLFGNDQDPFDGLLNSFAQPQRHGDSDVFLRASVDHTDVYLGEQTTLSLYICSRVGILSYEQPSFPKLDGFWAEEVPVPAQAQEERVINGVPYVVSLLRRRALFPLHAGDVVIDPITITLTLEPAMFAMAPPETVKRKSAPIKLTVKPLPAEGQPPGFEASNVGTFTLTAQASPQTAQLGQAVQYKMTLEGSGNIKDVHVPKPVLPAGLKTFDPTVTDKLKAGIGKSTGTKTIEWVIIPERTGEFTIPGVELSYFDPAKGAYASVHTDNIPLHVAAGPAGSAPALTANGQVAAPVATNELSGGIRPIRLHSDVVTPAQPLWRQPFFWPLTGGPVVAWAFLWSGAFVLGSLRRRDPKRLKEKRAHSAANQRLRKAEAMLEANDTRGFYAEVIQALQQFVTDKTSVAALGLTRDELGHALIERGFRSMHVHALVRLLETCESARFSPVASSPAEMTKVIADTHRIIDALETVGVPAGVA